MNFRHCRCQEVNCDALEINLLAINKSQGREAKVKAFLEKIQVEFITLEPTNVAEIFSRDIWKYMKINI